MIKLSPILFVIFWICRSGDKCKFESLRSGDFMHSRCQDNINRLTLIVRLTQKSFNFPNMHVCKLFLTRANMNPTSTT